MPKTKQPKEVAVIKPPNEDEVMAALGESEESRDKRHLQRVSAETLISQAIEKSVPVETMERLLAMRRELKAEWAKEEYNRAMAAFQAECPTIQKTKEVLTDSGQRAYRYAPIESILEQVKPLLEKHGFSYSTSMELMEDGVKVVCKVTHAAGHSEESPMHVPLGNKTKIMSQTQVVAAAQTFAKRYALCNAFGILTGDEDNDAAPPPPANAPNFMKPSAAPKGPKPETSEMLKHLSQLLIDLKIYPNAEAIRAAGKEVAEKVKTLTDEKLTPKNLPAIIDKLEILNRTN